jgi:glucose 1-dehydrogenase
MVIDYVVHPEATETLERQVSKLGSQSIGVAADVSKCADLEKLVDAAVERFGRLDIMVNNAGIEIRTSILDTSEAHCHAATSLDLHGTRIS